MELVENPAKYSKYPLTILMSVSIVWIMEVRVQPLDRRKMRLERLNFAAVRKSESIFRVGHSLTALPC